MLEVLELVDRAGWPAEDAGLSVLGLAAGTALDVSFEAFNPTYTDLLQLDPSKVLASLPGGTFAELVLRVGRESRAAKRRSMGDCLHALLRGALELQEVGATEPEPERSEDSWLEAALGSADLTEPAVAAARRLDAYVLRLVRLKRRLLEAVDKLSRVDHYAVLGVSPECSAAELKRAYRSRCLKLHPDKGGDKDKFQQLQRAYAAVLEKRAAAAPQPAPASAASAPEPAPTHQSAASADPESPPASAGVSEPLLEVTCLAAAEDPSVRGMPAFREYLGRLKTCRARAAEVSDAVAAADKLLGSLDIFVEHPSIGALGSAVTALRKALSTVEACALNPLADATEDAADHATLVSCQSAWVPAAALLQEKAQAASLLAACCGKAEADLRAMVHDLRGTLGGLAALTQLDREGAVMAVKLLDKARQRAQRLLAMAGPWATKAAGAAGELEEPLAETLRQARSVARPVTPDDPGAEPNGGPEQSEPAPETPAPSVATQPSASEVEAQAKAKLAQTRVFARSIAADVRSLQRDLQGLLAATPAQLPPVSVRCAARLLGAVAEVLSAALEEAPRGFTHAFGFLLTDRLPLHTDMRTQLVQVAHAVDSDGLTALIAQTQELAPAGFRVHFAEVLRSLEPRPGTGR